MKIAMILTALFAFGCTYIQTDEGVLSNMQRPIIVVGIHKKSDSGWNSNGNATVRDAKGEFRILQSWFGLQVAESYKVGDTLK